MSEDKNVQLNPFQHFLEDGNHENEQEKAEPGPSTISKDDKDLQDSSKECIPKAKKKKLKKLKLNQSASDKTSPSERKSKKDKKKSKHKDKTVKKDKELKEKVKKDKKLKVKDKSGKHVKEKGIKDKSDKKKKKKHKSSQQVNQDNTATNPSLETDVQTKDTDRKLTLAKSGASNLIASESSSSCASLDRDCSSQQSVGPDGKPRKRRVGFITLSRSASPAFTPMQGMKRIPVSLSNPPSVQAATPKVSPDSSSTSFLEAKAQGETTTGPTGFKQALKYHSPVKIQEGSICLPDSTSSVSKDSAKSDDGGKDKSVSNVADSTSSDSVDRSREESSKPFKKRKLSFETTVVVQKRPCLNTGVTTSQGESCRKTEERETTMDNESCKEGTSGSQNSQAQNHNDKKSTEEVSERTSDKPGKVDEAGDRTSIKSLVEEKAHRTDDECREEEMGDDSLGASGALISPTQTATIQSKDTSDKSNLHCEMDKDESFEEANLTLTPPPYRKDSDTSHHSSSSFNSSDSVSGNSSRDSSGASSRASTPDNTLTSQLLGELSSLNNDSLALSTDIHRRKTPKKGTPRSKRSLSSTPRHMSAKKTPTRIKFNFKTPTKSGVKSSTTSTPISALKSKRRLYKDDNDAGEGTSKRSPGSLSPPNVDDDSDSSSSEEEGLSILEADPSLDNKIDDIADRQALNGINVRNLLKEVLMDPEVMGMFQKSVQEDETLRNQLQEVMEPQILTRTKLKQVLKDGSMPPSWTLSPLKGMQKTEEKPGFLDLNFADDESDQEYRPEQAELEQTDDESIASSNLSDIGSPQPGFRSGASTPGPSLTPKLPSIAEGRSSVFNTSISQDFDAPAAARTRSKKPMKDKKLDQLEKELYNTPIDRIENEEIFKAPDFYQKSFNVDEDPEWQAFLQTLQKDTDELNDTHDDELNDPEFDFMEELGKAEEDPENLKEGRAVEIPKKELNELMDELFEVYMEDYSNDAFTEKRDLPDTQCPQPQSGDLRKVDKPAAPVIRSDSTTSEETQSEEATPSTSKEADKDNTDVEDAVEDAVEEVYRPVYPKLRTLSDKEKALVNNASCGRLYNLLIPEPLILPNNVSHITDDERLQLQDQLRKFVQLVTQTHVMCAGNPDLANVSSESKKLLIDLYMRGQMSPLGTEKTAFRVPHLDLALKTLSQGPPDDSTSQQEVLEQCIDKKRFSANYKNVNVYKESGLSYWQMSVFAHSKVFMWPQMLPDVKFYSDDNRRVTFTEAEDNLIAIGLDLFKPQHHQGPVYYQISMHLLPTKTKEQIRYRAKNLKARSKLKMNAVKYLMDNDKLPDFQRYTILEDVEEMVPPVDRDSRFLPIWFNVYLNAKEELDIKERPETSASLIPLVPTSRMPTSSKQPSQRRPASTKPENEQEKSVKAAVRNKRSKSAPTTTTTMESAKNNDGNKTGRSQSPLVNEIKSVSATLGMGMSAINKLNVVRSRPGSPSVPFQDVQDHDSPLKLTSNPPAGAVSVKPSNQRKPRKTAAIKKKQADPTPVSTMPVSMPVITPVSTPITTLFTSATAGMKIAPQGPTVLDLAVSRNQVQVVSALTSPVQAATPSISSSMLYLTPQQMARLGSQGAVVIATGDGQPAPAPTTSAVEADTQDLAEQIDSFHEQHDMPDGEAFSSSFLSPTKLVSGSLTPVKLTTDNPSVLPSSHSTPTSAATTQDKPASSSHDSPSSNIDTKTANTPESGAVPSSQNTPPVAGAGPSNKQMTPTTPQKQEIIVSTPSEGDVKKRPAQVAKVQGVGHVLTIPNTPEKKGSSPMKIVFRDATPSSSIMALAFSSATGISVEDLKESPKLVPQMLGLSPLKESPRKMPVTPQRLSSVRKQLSVIQEEKEDCQGAEVEEEVLATPLDTSVGSEGDPPAQANSFRGISQSPQAQGKGTGTLEEGTLLTAESLRKTSAAVLKPSGVSVLTSAGMKHTLRSGPITSSTPLVSSQGGSQLDSNLPLPSFSLAGEDSLPATGSPPVSSKVRHPSLPHIEDSTARADFDNTKITPPRPEGESSLFKIPVTPNANTNSMFNIPSLDLNMLADNTTMMGGSSTQSSGPMSSTTSVLTTPTKLQYEGTMMSPYRPSPSSSLRSSPQTPQTPETPTKQAVEQLAAEARNMLITPPRKYWSPGGTTLMNRTPGSGSSISSVASSVKSPLFCSPGRRTKEKRTPPKTPQTPRFILPKESKSPSPLKGLTSPFLPKIKKSPRRKLLNDKVRAILPKGMLLTSPVKLVSPVKQAAASIAARARHIATQSPHKPSPRPPLARNIFSPKSVASSRGDSDSEGEDDKSPGRKDQDQEVEEDEEELEVEEDEQENPEVDDLTEQEETEHESETEAEDKSDIEDDIEEEEVEEEEEFDDEVKENGELDEEEEVVDLQGEVKDALLDEDDDEEEIQKLAEAVKEEEQEEELSTADEEEQEQEAEEESDDEEEDLARLYAASSTINGAPLSQEEKLRTKQERKRAKYLEMMQPNIVSTDPKRDDKDTAFAHAYMRRVREALKCDDKYGQFLSLLLEFERNGRDPVQLYGDVHSLLCEFPALTEDFSTFLLPHQAQGVQASAPHIHYDRARTFLRKIEISFKNKPQKHQAIMELLTSTSMDPAKLQVELWPLLKGHPHLMEEAAFFFKQVMGTPREVDSFETATLPHSSSDSDDCSEDDDFDEEEQKTKPPKQHQSKEPDSFEEVELDVKDEGQFGTQWCKCSCHDEVAEEERSDEETQHTGDLPDTMDDNLLNRRMHCIDCAVKVHKGKMFLQTDKKLQHMRVVYKDPDAPDTDNQSETGSHVSFDADSVDASDSDEAISIKDEEEDDGKDDELDEDEVKDEELDGDDEDDGEEDDVPSSEEELEDDSESQHLKVKFGRRTASGFVDSPTSRDSHVSYASTDFFSPQQQQLSHDDSDSDVQQSQDGESKRKRKRRETEVTDNGSPDEKRGRVEEDSCDNDESEDAREWTREEDLFILTTCQAKGMGEEVCGEIAQHLNISSPTLVKSRLVHLINLAPDLASSSETTDTS